MVQLPFEPGGPKWDVAQLEAKLDMMKEVEVEVGVRELCLALRKLKKDGTWSHVKWKPSCF